MSDAALASIPRNDSSGWLGHGLIVALGSSSTSSAATIPPSFRRGCRGNSCGGNISPRRSRFTGSSAVLGRLPRAERPALWRIASFVLGVLSIYVVLQTRLDYYALHMFFVHRAQHFVLHHSGAFLIALGASGPALWAGMPRVLHPILGSRPVKALVDFIQHPAVAPVLFVGLIYLWLVPSLHTRVMLDLRLYNLMNASMAIDGIFFWCLILDPRPKPPARIGSGLRALLVIAVEPFQMILGAILSLSSTDFYPVYRICGRIWDITAISDMHYGGLIIWLPSTLTSFAGMIVVLVNMRLNDEAAERGETTV